MSDFDSSTPVSEIFRRATERIDGRVMYGLIALYLLLYLIFVFELEKLLPFQVRGPKGNDFFLIMIPIWPVYYISFGTHASSDSRGSQIWNAAWLVGMGLYPLYRFFTR